jgi:lipopolysaccharide export system protein LptA
MKKHLAVAILSLASLSAWAERADSLKQAVINFETLDVDEVNQVRILTGNVVLTRGTLTLKSDKAVLKESPEGYMSVVLTANAGKTASFRQKRDGGPDLWGEGQAQRIEYDERNDIVKLFSKAVIRQLEGKKVTQEMASEFISYDNRNEKLLGLNDANGVDKPGNGRGSITLQPRRAPAAGAAPAPAGKQ